MALSLKATGAWTVGVTDPQSVTLVGTPAAGDRYFLWATWKAFGTTCSVTGWTKITEFTDGSVAAGASTGSMKVACFYKDWVTGDANPSLDWSAAPAPAAWVMQLWQKGSGDGWAAPVFATAAWASSAGATVNASATVAVSDGAAVFNLAGIRNDSATFARPTTAIAGTGITWNGNYVESPATHVSDTTSNDLSADLGYRLVTTGGTGITLTSTITTLSAAETGALLWVVQSLNPATASLTDTFGSQDAAKWSYAASVTATGGVLSIIPDNTFGRSISSVVNYNLTGSYTLLEVTALGSAQIVSLPLIADGSNRLEIFYNFGDLVFRETVATVTSDTTVTYNSTTHRWWRLRESGGTVFWDTSPDGVTWTNQRSKTWAIPQITSLNQQVMAYTASGVTPATADNFNLPPTGGPIAATAKKLTASLTGAMQPKGTIAAQLAKALFSGTGTQTQTGTVAALLKKATASLTGAEHPRGTVAATMKKPTASFTGAQTQSGTVAATLRKPTASFTGAMQPKGVLAGTARKATATLTGSQQQIGVVAAASKKLTASLLGAQQPSGTISATAKRAAFAATGTQAQSGTIVVNARRLAAALTGAQEQSGTIAAAMRPVLAAVAGAMQPSGFVTVTLRPAIFAASGTQTQQGVIAVTTRNVAAALSGVMQPQGVIAAALPPALFGGSGTQATPPGTAASIMKNLSASLSGHEAPEGAISAAMNPAQFSGQGKQVQQGIAAATLRAATFAAVGNQPTSGALSAVLHRLAFAGQGTKTSLVTGTMFAHGQRLVAALAGAMAPSGQVATTLSPPLFEGSADYLSPLGLRVTLRALVFHSLRTAHDSAERTTIIPGENRVTIIPGENRTTFIPNEDRLTVIDR